jgi:hypothetical protein
MARHGNLRGCALGMLAFAFATLAVVSRANDGVTVGEAEWATRFEFAGVVDGVSRVTTPVTLGVDPAATDGFDRGADLLAPPLPPGRRSAEAYMHRPEASGFFRRLNKDMRGPALGDDAAIVWEIVVVNPTQAEWGMTWDPDTIPAEWQDARLSCDHGSDVDMRSTASAVVHADSTCVFGVTVGRVSRPSLLERALDEKSVVTERSREAAPVGPAAKDVTEITFATVQTGPADVDRDGAVDMRDLLLVARVLGGSVDDPTADVDGDGRVTARDLILVAVGMRRTAAAPSRSGRDDLVSRLLAGGLSPEEVVRRLTAPPTDTPTRLLPNYPNPFNPETWVPFDLDRPSEVSVTVYDIRGSVVRRLALGHREPGSYHAPGRAAYWNGRTDTGEAAVSGAYVVVLRAGGAVARRRIILTK